MKNNTVYLVSFLILAAACGRQPAAAPSDLTHVTEQVPIHNLPKGTQITPLQTLNLLPNDTSVYLEKKIPGQKIMQCGIHTTKTHVDRRIVAGSPLQVESAAEGYNDSKIVVKAVNSGTELTIVCGTTKCSNPKFPYLLDRTERGYQNSQLMNCYRDANEAARYVANPEILYARHGIINAMALERTMTVGEFRYLFAITAMPPSRDL
jgi:hypothetical protein